MAIKRLNPAKLRFYLLPVLVVALGYDMYLAHLNAVKKRDNVQVGDAVQLMGMGMEEYLNAHNMRYPDASTWEEQCALSRTAMAYCTA